MSPSIGSPADPPGAIAAMGATPAAENIFWSWLGSVVRTVLSGGTPAALPGGTTGAGGALDTVAAVEEPGDTSSV
jgi:hypothetical protein